MHGGARAKRMFYVHSRYGLAHPTDRHRAMQAWWIGSSPHPSSHVRLFGSETTTSTTVPLRGNTVYLSLDFTPLHVASVGNWKLPLFSCLSLGSSVVCSPRFQSPPTYLFFLSSTGRAFPRRASGSILRFIWILFSLVRRVLLDRFGWLVDERVSSP